MKRKLSGREVRPLHLLGFLTKLWHHWWTVRKCERCSVFKSYFLVLKGRLIFENVCLCVKMIPALSYDSISNTKTCKWKEECELRWYIDLYSRRHPPALMDADTSVYMNCGTAFWYRTPQPCKHSSGERQVLGEGQIYLASDEKGYRASWRYVYYHV